MPGKKCPHCYEMMAPDTDVCLWCGYSISLGAKAHEVTARKRAGLKKCPLCYVFHKPTATRCSVCGFSLERVAPCAEEEIATDEYVGCVPRLRAAAIDAALILLIILPVLLISYGWSYFTADDFIKGPLDFFVTWIFPLVVTVLFWARKAATPGKMAISAKIVDADTRRDPDAMQCLIRYCGYFISAAPLLLGFVWIAFDERRQGWHDKLANTVVIRPLPDRSPQ